MSFDYYKSQGYMQVTPKFREISNAAAPSTAITIWTPLTSMRIVLASVSVSCNPGGTIAFFFGGNQQVKLAQYSIPASTTIWPEIEGWESTAVDAPLYVNVSTGATNGWTISAEGFELE